MGFEPTEPCGSRALQARAFGRTTLPLHLCVYSYAAQVREIIPCRDTRVQALDWCSTRGIIQSDYWGKILAKIAGAYLATMSDDSPFSPQISA